MRALPIKGEYPADWDEIGDRVRSEVGHRCIRCKHPYRTGQHGKGEWSPCDEQCDHGGPLAALVNAIPFEVRLSKDAFARHVVRQGFNVVAQWRILTVHHLDGDKSNCEWWNLLALCQRCHLTIQCRVNPQIPWFLEHSDWFKPYVAGFYANKYEGRNITRTEAIARMDELLKYERIA